MALIPGHEWDEELKLNEIVVIRAIQLTPPSLVLVKW
jgi:hypothetical protein